MAKTYIRAVQLQPVDTLSLTASANDFIANATAAAPSGGGLAAVNSIDIEIYNNVMYVIMSELDELAGGAGSP